MNHLSSRAPLKVSNSIGLGLPSRLISSLVFQTGISHAVEIFKLAASRLMQTFQSLKFPTVQSREMQTVGGLQS